MNKNSMHSNHPKYTEPGVTPASQQVAGIKTAEKLASVATSETTTASKNVHVRNTQYSWIEPVLFLTESKYLNIGMLKMWMDIFPTVQVAATVPPPAGIPKGIGWHIYHTEEFRSEVWNRMMKQSAASWVLFIEDDEKIHLPSLPNEGELDERNWKPALVQWSESKVLRQSYQIRLVANTGEDCFNGKHLPDGTTYITSRDIDLSDVPILIYRGSNPYDKLNAEGELSVQNPSPQVYLVMGERFFDKGKYVHASAQYRKVLKLPKILLYDRLAAMNGLASCLAEQYKWTQAMELAVESINNEPCQRLPYLILFRIHQLAKRWGDAHKCLSRYYDLKKETSSANFDKMLSEEPTLEYLAEIAFKAGLREESYGYYKKLHLLKGKEVSAVVLKRLLLFAIEFSDSRQAMRYFDIIFSDKITDKLDQKTEASFFEFLALFMKQGWYEFASERFRQLLDNQPSHETCMRRWLVALLKSKDIEKARKVFAGIQISKKAG